MGLARTSDGLNLYFEVSGGGTPIIFVHEYAGDHRSWEPQVRYFSRMYKCITYNARGYPPSDVPSDVNSYSQDLAREDLLSIMDHLKIKAAHIVGLSMGGFATLHFGMNYPKKTLSMVVAGCGYGAEPKQYKKFQIESLDNAKKINKQSMNEFGKTYGQGPTRIQFKTKSPRGWAEFEKQLREHSTVGSANTMQGIQGQRPSLYDFEEQIRAIRIPTLIINGDEDEPCLNVGSYLKHHICNSGLVILPKTGHTSNLEEPDHFNDFCAKFFHQVDIKAWK